MKRVSLSLAAAALAVTLGSGALANTCENFTAYQERVSGIPAHLLTAVARAESGRYDENTGLASAWPWTVTSPEGDVKYSTKWEAIDAVSDLQKRGVSNIDVGCMQINLHHHPYAFANLNIAFDPAANVAYAAHLLVGHYRSTGDWRSAVALYHSADPDLGSTYQAKVDDLWQQARADATYAAWDGDTGDEAAERAREWDMAAAQVHGDGSYSYGYTHTWRYSDDRPWRQGRTWRSWVRYPDHPRRWHRFGWYGDRNPGHVHGHDDDTYRILPYPYEPGPWRPVGTSRFN